MEEPEVKPKAKRSLFRKIINVFIGIFLGIIFLTVILIGFTQTITFREWLRAKVIDIANTELNGKINIEKIDGTILTSIFLRNTSLTVDGDTLVFAQNIQIKTSPLQLLLKKIYFRKIQFENVKVNFLQNSEGTWNYANLIKPSVEDTSQSSFPFLIQVNDLQLKNISIINQSYPNLNSNRIYQNINYDDLQIQNLYLSAQALIDIDKTDYLLQLKELSFKPNLYRFTLKNISGIFALNDKFMAVEKFTFISDSSDIRLSARLDSLNIFGNASLSDFENSPITVDLDASSFNFDDLSSFIGATEILKGNPSLELKARGKFGNIKIQRAILDYQTTHFEFSGDVLNLNNPEKLFLKINIKDTDLNYKDVNLLLPSLQLPEFAKLSATDVNVEYEGEPLNFKSKFVGVFDKGKLKFDCAMNLAAEPMTYDIKFETNELDLSSVIGMPTSINSIGSVLGKGLTPADLKANFNIDILGSMINNIPVDELTLKSSAENRKIKLDLEGTSDKAIAEISGDMEFDQDTIPSYSLLGTIKGLDLSSLLKDDEYKSDLNFTFSAEGRNLNPDDITGDFSFGLDSSNYRGTDIPFSTIEIVLKKDSTNRSINLISDFVDFNIEGNFSLQDAAKLLTYESQTITSVISKKIEELNPLAIVNQSNIQDTLTTDLPDIVDKDLTFDFDFTFKNFELIATLLGNDRLDIIGKGIGSVTNKAPNFSINTELELDYAIFIQQDLTVYLSDFDLDVNLTRDNRFESFDKLFGTASLTGKRFYSGGNITNINADLVFNQSKLFFNAAADIQDNIKVETEGIVLMTPVEQQLLFDQINFNYDGISWVNKDTVKILFNPKRFNIAKCNLENGKSLLGISGIIESNGNQDLKVKANNITGSILSKYLLGQNNPDFKASGNLDIAISGTFQSPSIFSNVKLEKLEYQKFKLGHLAGTLTYKDKKVSTDFNFLDSTYNLSKPLLSFSGSIPIDLSFATVENRLPENESMDLKLKSENFNIHSLGNLIPGISGQTGNFLADLELKGNLTKPEFYGYLKLSDGNFRSTFNNLNYNCGVKLSFEKNGIKVDSLLLANEKGTKFNGEINGVGSMILDGFEIKDLGIRFNGDLAVLSQQSRSVSPLFYGDLLIGTKGDWIVTKRGDKFFFKGDVQLKHTDLVYTTGQESISQSSNFNIIYVVDSTKIDKELLRFQEILSEEQALQKQKSRQTIPTLNFDYEIGVSVENSARLLFILSQAINQKLYVEMRGDLKYESYSGETRAQGAFELMEGSRLEFFKTFDASGILRFESDVTNPFLDILATYIGDYEDPRDPNSGTQEVAVKIKIKGPLSELGKNLATNQESLGVYVGKRNIDNNTRDARYDYADAFSFILIGKFKDDLTAQDKAVVAGETNAIGTTVGKSFLGSVLTSFVNSAVGDLINNIQIGQSGELTKFSLSGRIQNLRYSFGGTTEVFQNIRKANVKVEYPFTPKFLIRLERKDPIGQSYITDEKIDELALKYRFEF